LTLHPAGHAAQTFFLLQKILIETGGAMAAALATVRTERLGAAPKRRETGQESEQRPQGAETPAPEPGFVPLEKNNAEKQCEGQKGQGIKRFPERQQVVPQKSVSGRKHVAPFPENPIEADPALAHRVTEQRIHGESQRPEQNGNRVQESNEITVEESGKQQWKEQPVLDPALEKFQRCRLPDFSGHQIEDRAEGTDPAAEKPAKNQRGHCHEEGREEQNEVGFFGQEITEADQGIGPKKTVHRKGDPVAAPIFRLYEQKEKKQQKNQLRNAC